ncbi:hypothetical protein EYF80_053388 [Liparis tanakae]|uniref:Uncharacterized protein n=1 Tax=Liparis tanakae TaxID=230148 RepID=A0A4Z2F5D3_9TELE|nr:hypothetical protein EYF80_053388 [Liparis tanakae]
MNQSCTFIEALEHSGTPFSYFPVMIPPARGDQDTTPTPEAAAEPLSNMQHYVHQAQPQEMETHRSYDHRDVPQYMDIPWLITWVIDLTISVKRAEQCQ